MIKTIFSILLSIMLFISIFASIALTVILPKNITTAVTKVDFIWLLEEMGHNIEIDRVEYFFKRDAVTYEISKVAERYIIAAMNGDFDYHITTEEIVDFLKLVSTDVLKEFGYWLTDDDYNLIANLINEYGNLNEYSVGRLLKEANINFAVLYIIFSYYPLKIMGILCIVFIFNIFLLHRKNVRFAFLAVGISAISVGLVYCITASLLFSPLPGLFGYSFIQTFIKVAAGLIYLSLFFGLLSLGLGIISLGIFFIIKNKRKQQPQKEYVKNNKILWRIFGFLFNAAALTVCIMLLFLFFKDLPEVFAFSMHRPF